MPIVDIYPTVTCNRLRNTSLLKTEAGDVVSEGNTVLPFKAGLHNLHIDSAVINDKKWDGLKREPDPYVVVHKKRADGKDSSINPPIMITETEESTYEPKWDFGKEIEFTGEELLEFDIYDEDTLFDDYIGTCKTEKEIYKLPFKRNMVTLTNCDENIAEIKFKMTRGE